MSIRPIGLSKGALVVCAVSVFYSCAPEPTPPLSLRVTWGLNDTAALPDDVAEIEVITCINAGQADESCSPTTCSVNAITGMTADEVRICRPRAGTEMYGEDPVLVRSDLPTDAPIRFRLHGKLESGEIAYVGQLGPLVLGEGERRYAALRMYDVGASTLAPQARAPRLLHTSTLLPDGRILIAGGFDTITHLDACPAELGLSAETQCFDLTATDEALAFDVASGTIVPIRNPMLAARGGHTATALPDGRVLLAGGAARAILAISPQGAGGVAGFSANFFPRLADGLTAGAEASLELFDAYLDEEAEDLDRDGDLGRGAFLGTAGQMSTPVPMNQPRFLHAAAVIAATPSRVLLVGGMGGTDSAATWEVFDNERVGGYGVYFATTNRLTTPRLVPGAIGVGDRVWIFGGTIARDNAQLAEFWTEDPLDPNGVVVVASMGTQFPNPAVGAAELHPDFSLLRPHVAAIDGGSRALVVGWYGPQCDVGMSTPVFPPAGTPSEYCPPPVAPATRSFTVTDSTGITAPTQARTHAFGDVAVLTCFRPGRDERYVAVAGGIANTSWLPQPAIDVFSGEVDASGAADVVVGISPSLSSPRFFQTATGIPGLGVVTIGGVSFGVDTSQLFFVDTAEVLFVPSPAPEDC